MTCVIVLKGMCSAKKESMNYLLSHPDGGKGAVLIPGGLYAPNGFIQR
jgi:hypothetical protein